MEKFVSADYVQFKNDDSNRSNNPSNTPMCFSSNFEKNECKGCGKISRVKKKVVSQESFVNQSDPFDNVTLSKNKKRSSIPKAQVLNKIATEAARQSVQKKTKIIKRNVPDRLGKYVSYSVRSETKLFLSDCKLKTKSPSCECKKISDFKSLKEHSKVKLLFDGYTETKLALIGNECLSNKEAVSLSNSFESDSVRKNIFESFFDNCLSSTSEEKDASSQVNLYFKDNSNSLKINSERVGKYNLLESLENWEKGSVKGVESDKTPPKKNRGSSPPVKIKDHSNYYKSHKNIRHVCGYCQKIFKSNGKLNNHVFSHTGERPFHCSHCGKAFSSKFKLVRHLLIHSEIRKFVCQICDRTFLRNDHLKNHYKVHDPQKKMYKCPKENCDKEYSSIMSHKKHMAYHSVEDGDLKCLICHVKYETKEEILFHLKSHSGSRLFKSQSDKKFKCEFCERLFLTRKDVTRHLVVHTGERDFLCQFCPQRFGRKDHLVRHIKKSHGNESITTFKREEVKGLKEKMKTPDDQKTKLIKKRQIGKDLNSTSSITLRETRPCSHSDSTTLAPGNIQKEDNDDHKTHVVITVQGKSMENGLQCRKRNSVESENKKKSFQKNESASPKKKQVVLAKTKNPTTQILLQNVPNILIIPNNSIILVRNQGPGIVRKSAEQSATRAALDGESLARAPESSAPRLEGDFLGQPPPSLQTPATSDSFNGNLIYDSPSLFSSSQFLGAYPDGDGFCNFQADLMSCASQFGESFQSSFEMLNRADLLPRSEAGSIGMPSNVHPRSETASNGNLLTETSRQIKLLESGISALQSGGEEKADKEKTECEALGKDFFEDGLLNESILNDFKDETSGILPTDHDVSILSNILNQSSDNCGFELLKNLLTSENPSPSPLPGFSQIFQNSNTHSN